jgi:hypothetical protein
VKKKNTEYDVNLKKIKYYMVGSKNQISFIHCEKAVSLLRWFSAECVCKLFRKNRRNSSFSAEYICNNLYWFNFCGMYLEIFGGKKS